MESATCERGFLIRTLTETGQRYWLGDNRGSANADETTSDTCGMTGNPFENYLRLVGVSEIILSDKQFYLRNSQWNKHMSRDQHQLMTGTLSIVAFVICSFRRMQCADSTVFRVCSTGIQSDGPDSSGLLLHRCASSSSTHSQGNVLVAL